MPGTLAAFADLARYTEQLETATAYVRRLVNDGVDAGEIARATDSLAALQRRAADASGEAGKAALPLRRRWKELMNYVYTLNLLATAYCNAREQAAPLLPSYARPSQPLLVIT